MEAKEKIHLNVAFIGHSSSGKTTTLAHLLCKTGRMDERILEDVSSTLKYSHILDKLPEEREKGMSFKSSRWSTETPQYNLTLADAPGFQKYTKTMIRSTSQTDAAVLCVSAVQGEFEAGMSKDGQTREHLLLAYTLGVKQLIVCINKIDEKKVAWSQARYNEIKVELSSYIKKIGYNPDKVSFIPISGLYGDNLVERSLNMAWFTGPTLLKALDKLIPPKRPKEKPLRFPIQDVFRVGGVGTVVIGTVQTGVVRPGMVLKFAPGGVSAEVKSIEMHHETIQEAGAGDYIGMCLKAVSTKELKRGYIGGDASNDPPCEVKSFLAQVIVLNHPGRLASGYTPYFYAHTAHVPCKFSQIDQKIDKATGKENEDLPKFIKSGDAGLVTFTTVKPLCVEVFSEYPHLGRFALRDMNQTVAVGVIKSIEKKK